MLDLASSPSDTTLPRSLSGNIWQLRPADDATALAVAREHDIPELLARVVLARGIAADDVHDYLNPSLKASLPDPSHLKDMDAAAERLAAAVIASEKIAIFGDYDVDGATSTALLRQFFRMLGLEPLIYIPDRIKEGYGPNTQAFMQLKERGATVIVTVDCGTLAHAPLAAAFEAGIDVIVADHHQGEARKPQAYAIVNPNRLDETSPHRHLAAVGVCFLLAVAVVRTLRARGHFSARREPDMLALLDLVALGTVCDVVALTGVNRAYVAQGLKVMCQRRNTGLRALMDVSRLEERASAYTCGFVLGPRVNAGGRVGKAHFGAELLSSECEIEAGRLASALDTHNEERKAIECLVLEDALARATAQVDAPVIVVAGEGWHPGVIGIVAGRLKERFARPVAVIALERGVGKASARSVPGFDFGAAVIAACDSGLLVGGGGHAMAAGFTVEERHLPALTHFLCLRFAQQVKEAQARVLKADARVALSGITAELAHMLEQAAPFGQGNGQPRLMLENVRVIAVEPVGSGEHLRVVLADESKTRLRAMAFRCAGTPLGNSLPGLVGRKVHVLGNVRIKTWQGQEQVNFTAEDVALA